jgi:PhnB protein
MATPSLHPRLVVGGASDAISFYRRAFGAEVAVRLNTPAGHVVHAELRIGEAMFSLTEAAPAGHDPSPRSLGGSPVILSLSVPDAHAVAKRAVEAGATVVFPVQDQFYGKREGRIRDPFGHLWIVSSDLEELTAEELQRRVDAEM